MGSQKGLTTYGESIVSVNDAITVMLNGGSLGNAVIVDEEEVQLFNNNAEQILGSAEILNTADTSASEEEFHKKRTAQWDFPDEYKAINVLDFLISKCKTEKEIERVAIEYILYEERNLIVLLQFFIYLVNHMRNHKILWGVGRGSSVASYILYLIGIHRIDSIKYDLQIEEFLK